MPNTCLLCRDQKVYLVKSHLTPAGISKNTFGERNKEHIFTIDTQNKEIDEYFGSEYIQNKTKEVKNPPNSRKGIFCKTCESDLETYETAVQPKLEKFISSIGKGLETYQTKDKAKYSEIGIHPNILYTYFESIIWRQCLEQTLDEHQNPLTNEQFEILRQELLVNIKLPVKEIISKRNFPTRKKITIFTTYNIKNQPSTTNPHQFNTNPLVFFIGPIILLYWLADKPTIGFNQITQINDNLLDLTLALDSSRIGVVNEANWNKILNVLFKTAAHQYNQKPIK